jgi:hypothetical protein
MSESCSTNARTGSLSGENIFEDVITKLFGIGGADGSHTQSDKNTQFRELG